MTITDVQTQRRRAERRSIFIDGEFALGVSEETYVRYALYRGREVTEEFIEEVRRADEVYRCKSYALRFLGHRMRSRRELEERMAIKGFPPHAITATMKFLEEYGMVDDEQFARAFVNDQLLRRPIGRRRLRQELGRKGVARAEVDRTLGAAVTDDDELRNAMEAARRKAPNLRQDDPRKRERTMANFLAGRGFGWNVVGKVIDAMRNGTLEENDDRA